MEIFFSPPIVITYIVTLGLIIGSFLNVCIYRIPLKLSLISPARSFCPKCKKQLRSRDNIPLLSWLFLRGRCGSCKEKISARYPFVELLSAFAAIECYLSFNSWTALYVYALLAVLIVISFIDLDYKRIPDVITYPVASIGLLLSIVSEYYHPFTWPIAKGILDSVFGMYLGGGIFYVIGQAWYFFTKEDGIGGGDVKLMGMTGAVMGVESVGHSVFNGTIVGGVVAVLLVLFAGGGRKTKIPFGPWLALGCVLYICNVRLLDLYIAFVMR